MPKDRSPSALAVWKQTTRAMGSPQNKEESPRTSRPNERNNSSLGAGSGIADEDGGWSVEDGSEQPTVIIHSRFSILLRKCQQNARLRLRPLSQERQKGRLPQHGCRFWRSPVSWRPMQRS